MATASRHAQNENSGALDLHEKRGTVLAPRVEGTIPSAFTGSASRCGGIWLAQAHTTVVLPLRDSLLGYLSAFPRPAKAWQLQAVRDGPFDLTLPCASVPRVRDYPFNTFWSLSRFGLP